MGPKTLDPTGLY